MNGGWRFSRVFLMEMLSLLHFSWLMSGWTGAACGGFSPGPWSSPKIPEQWRILAPAMIAASERMGGAGNAWRIPCGFSAICSFIHAFIIIYHSQSGWRAPKDAPGCSTMLHDAPRCSRMLQDAPRLFHRLDDDGNDGQRRRAWPRFQDASTTRFSHGFSHGFSPGFSHGLWLIDRLLMWNEWAEGFGPIKWLIHSGLTNCFNKQTTHRLGPGHFLTINYFSLFQRERERGIYTRRGVLANQHSNNFWSMMAAAH